MDTLGLCPRFLTLSAKKILCKEKVLKVNLEIDIHYAWSAKCFPMKNPTFSLAVDTHAVSQATCLGEESVKMIIIYINCILPGNFSWESFPEKCIIMAFNQSTWNLVISIWFRISHIGHFFHEKVFESRREIKIASNHSEFYLGSNLIPRVSQRVISHVDICS